MESQICNALQSIGVLFGNRVMELVEMEDLVVVWDHSGGRKLEVFSFWVSFSVEEHSRRLLPNHPSRDKLGHTCLSQGHPIGNGHCVWLDKQGNLQN